MHATGTKSRYAVESRSGLSELDGGANQSRTGKSAAKIRWFDIVGR